ncbi:zinc finger protein 468 [Biomphalaria pfeifferi]|uniref:Zinc finger protein 468 n=1 Tax=Biomphalaria pfeifferi TaxID=112525 RepID=A0AAD8ARX0_BIOPF|nr:zinc finger protein 468 [Biomphalaria pfeifferi]
MVQFLSYLYFLSREENLKQELEMANNKPMPPSLLALSENSILHPAPVIGLSLKSQISVSATEWDVEALKTQSSENHSEFSQGNKNQALKITEANKPTYPALRLMLSSNSSLHPVLVIRPNLKSEVPVSVSDVQEMKEINLQKEVEPSNINQFKSWHLEELKEAHIACEVWTWQQNITLTRQIRQKGNYQHSAVEHSKA